MPTLMSQIEVESQSNRNFDCYRRSRIVVESKPNRSRIAIVIAASNYVDVLVMLQQRTARLTENFQPAKNVYRVATIELD